MKNLKNILKIAVPVISLSFGSLKNYGQNTDKESEEAHSNLKKGLEMSVYENLALQYLDSSASILAGSFTRKQLISKLDSSSNYLAKSIIALENIAKDNYQFYEDKSAGLTIGIETKLDRGEAKKILPKIKELREIEKEMLNESDKIDGLKIELLKERYSEISELMNNYLETKRE